jgi:superfamily II DNA or RNA helicase
VPADGRLLFATADDDAVDAARWAARLGFAGAQPTSARIAAPEGAGVRLADRCVAAVGLADGLGALARLATRRPDGWPGWRSLPDSVTAWAALTATTLRLVAGHRVAPALRWAHDGGVLAGWTALLDHDPQAQEAVDRLAGAMPPAAHALAWDDARVWSAPALARAFVDAVTDACVRHAAQTPGGGRPRARLLPWTERWREALSDPVDPTVPLRQEEAGELVAGVQAWRQPPSGQGHLALRLEAPGDAQAPWRLVFGVRGTDGVWHSARSLWRGGDPAGADDGNAATGPPLDDADRDQLVDALLRGLGQLGRVLAPVDAALAEAEPTACQLDVAEAWRLIDEIAPLASGDLELELPPELVERPQVQVRLDAGAGEAAEVGDLSEALSDDDLARAVVEVAVDGETLGADELDALLATEAPLVAWRGRWVPVDDEARRLLATATNTSLPLRDAVVWAMAGSAPLSALAQVDDDAAGADVGVDVVADGRVATLLERLATARDAATSLTGVAEPAGFTGTLRAYQSRGVAWLGAMAELGVGGVLADDMGLGKTVELIAHLLRVNGAGPSKPHLVVCPTSVVGNWTREIARFAPELPVTRYHGADRCRDLTQTTGVVVTSYGTLRRDPEPLTGVGWHVVTLDEAQQVKNPATAGAKAVRRLDAAQTVALTGTPLENRLTELWTLLDATNPGLLGSRARFGRRFVGPVERHGDAAAAERLRRLVAPFVLRRRKDDPEVVADLPDKLERTVVAPLTAEQAQAYQAAVDRVLGDGLAADGMERRGRVLALLTELKQICNHPAQRDDDAEPVVVGRSGKLAATRDIVAEAVDAGEQVLVFTQFVEMGRLLARQLGQDLGAEIPLLHGGVSATARDRMVTGFQEGGPDAAPVLVVSLRAGGTGLNLTAATQVVHYDRWWNPAVEDQATDRAHRLGQTQRVLVHKLVTSGTVEERVATLLERKRWLADSVVGSGEEWLTELDDDAIADLVALSSSGEDLDDDVAQPWAEAS